MKRIALAFGVGFLGAAVLPSGTAQAASYDCSRARGADEAAVCRNATLSARDSEMGGLWYAYSRIPMLMGENGNRQEDLRAFSASRRRCAANIACLTRLYDARIAVLKEGIDGAMGAYSHIVLGTGD